MSEHDFYRLAETALDAIERTFESLIEQRGLDIDLHRQDNVITFEFHNEAQIIVNSHFGAQEIWVAAPSGGFHLSCVDGRWLERRAGEELWEMLSRLVSLQSGVQISVAPER